MTTEPATDSTAAADPSGGRRGTLLPFAAAVVIALVVVLAIVLLRGSKGNDFDLASSPTVPSGHAHDVVIHDGDTVRGQGMVLAVPGRPVRFCAPGVAAASASGTAVYCPAWVRVDGVDLAKLHGARHDAGATFGDALLTGVFRNDTLTVTHQVAPVSHESTLFHDVPPCSEPDGGWPKGNVDPAAAERYRSAHPDQVLLDGLLRPSRESAVMYVVTLDDPNMAGKALDPVYGKRLCVTRSPYTRAEFDAAARVLKAQVGSGLTRSDAASGSATTSSTGHVQLDADLPIVTAAFAKRVDAQPAGIIQLTVWLRPTG